MSGSSTHIHYNCALIRAPTPTATSYLCAVSVHVIYAGYFTRVELVVLLGDAGHQKRYLRQRIAPWVESHVVEVLYTSLRRFWRR